MKKLLFFVVATLVVFGFSRVTFAASTTTLTIYENSAVLDAGDNVVTVLGEYPVDYGNGSFASDGTGKTDMYFTPQVLFGKDNVTLADIASISYWTKKGTTHAVNPADWFINIYTKPYTGDYGTWYGDRIGTEPYFSIDINETAGDWNQWSTDGTSNKLRFFESTAGAPEATFGSYTDPEWSTFITKDALSGDPYAGHEILYISLQTGSAWADGFTGQLDGLRIELTDESVATVNFEPLDTDADDDGIANEIDECTENTGEDSWGDAWGTNRWQVMKDTYEVLGWYQNKPAKKGETLETFGFDLAYTYGCNGDQILELLTAELGENAMNGHKKFGLSSSVLEEFHWDMADGNLDGIYLLDTVVINANNINGANSVITLLSGVNYRFDVSSFWQNRTWEKVDAKYTSGDNWATYTDAPSGGFANELLDLQVNTNFVDWGTYSASHEYSINFAGNNSIANFRVFDGIGTPISGWYGDNIGSLTVKIYADL